MFEKYKHPSLEAGLLIILVVISIFSIGYYTESPTGMVSKEVTGNMVKVTGMETAPIYLVSEDNSDWVVYYPDDEKYEIYVDGTNRNTVLNTDTNDWNTAKVSFESLGYRVSQPPLPATTNQQLPTPTAQQQATLPQPAEAKYTTVSEENLKPEYLQKYTKLSILGADGYVYNINSDGTIILKTNEKFDFTTTVYSWKEYKYPYELTAKIPINVEGKTEYAYVTDTISAKNLNDAKKQFQEYHKGELITSITEGPAPSEPTTEAQLSTFEIDYIGGRNVVVEKKGDKAIRYYAPKVDEEQFVYELQESLQQREAARQEIINIKKENADKGISLTDHQAAQILLKDTGVDQSIKNGIEALGYKPAEPKEGEEKAPEIEGLVEITRNGEPTGTYSYKGKILIKEEEIEAAKKEWRTEKAIKEYKLTDSKYTDESGLEIYQTQDGRYKTINDNGEAVDYTGLFYKKEKPFGPENQVPVSVYVLEAGKKTPTFQYVYIEGIKGLKFDKETLMKITEKGGSVREIYDDTYRITGVEILKDGEVVRSIITGEYNAIERTGTRIIIDNEHVYFDSKGNKISKKEYEKLDEDGKNPKDVIIELREIEEFGKNKEGERSLITYYSETMKVKDKNIIIEGVKTDVEKNKILEYVYKVRKRDENGDYKEAVEIRFDDEGNLIDEEGEIIQENELSEEQKEILPEAQNSQKQFKSRRWFADFEFKLTQFRGLAGWSQLIFDKETLAEWREGVDKLFSTFYLGTDYWSSAICSRYIPKQQKGLLTMKTKDGLFDIVAHVEGERTLIPKPDGTKQYIYKLTLAVRNPKYSQYDKLQFNVYLHGEKTVKLYEQDISVEDGKSFTRGTGEMEDGQVTYTQEHGKPIVQYSDFLYNKICIKFTHSITNAEGSREDEVCNSIVEYQGSPTKYQQRTIPTTPGTPGAPGEPYQEADF